MVAGIIQERHGIASMSQHRHQQFADSTGLSHDIHASFIQVATLRQTKTLWPSE